MTLVFFLNFPQYALLPALTLNTYFIEVIQLSIMAKFLTHAEAPLPQLASHILLAAFIKNASMLCFNITTHFLMLQHGTAYHICSGHLDL